MAPAHSNLANAGDVAYAMCMRVKYRKTFGSGSAKGRDKFTSVFGVTDFGVHCQNRNAVYVNPLRCKELLTSTGTTGFRKEEVNHAFIVVEDVPPNKLAEVKRHNPTFEPVAAYNKRKSEAVEDLKGLFGGQYDPRFATLTHSHIMVVVRAWIFRAKWHIPYDEKHKITWVDDEGCLDLTAVADHPNFVELLEVSKEGMRAEVLDWRMDLEEPTAASRISVAFNEGNAMALEQTEIAALNALRGEILKSVQNNLSSSVEFDAVVAACKGQLGFFEGDPDLVEAFDVLVRLGVSKNTYADYLFGFFEAFVDSSKRRLPLSAFRVFNRLSEQCPWCLVALCERTYRQEPRSGIWLPGPEAKWANMHVSKLEILESLLRLFHVKAATLLQKKFEVEKDDGFKLKVYLANVDVTAIDALAEVTKNKSNTVDTIKEALCEALLTLYRQMGISGDDDVEVEDWIQAGMRVAAEKENDPQPKRAKGKKETQVKSLATIVTRDETSGCVIHGPAVYEPSGNAKDTKDCEYLVLPWRHWFGESGLAAVAGTHNGDLATAKAMLQQNHQANRNAIRQEKVEILTAFIPKEGVRDARKVIALETLKPGELNLPLCFCNQARLYTAAEGATNHPHAVRVVVETHGSTSPVFDSQAGGSSLVARGAKRPGAAVAGKGAGKRRKQTGEDTKESEPAATGSGDEDSNATEKDTKAKEAQTKEITEVLETAVAGIPCATRATRANTFYALPEFQAPKDGRNPKDVVKSVGVTLESSLMTVVHWNSRRKVHSLQQDMWKWSTNGDEAMHPFWAVARMDDQKLEKERAEATTKKVPENLRPRFNVKIEYNAYPVIYIPRSQDQPVTARQTVITPYITNDLEIRAGEELILKVASAKAKASAPKTLSWKQHRKTNMTTPPRGQAGGTSSRGGGAPLGNTFGLGGKGNPHPVPRGHPAR